MFGIESWPNQQASPIPQSDFNARIAGRARPMPRHLHFQDSVGVSSSSRFFHTKKYGRHKPWLRQNAFTLCPLRACSETSLRHFIQAFFERLVMSQHCIATRIFTRWGSGSAQQIHEKLRAVPLKH
jgi:hypothetical protein